MRGPWRRAVLFCAVALLAASCSHTTRSTLTSNHPKPCPTPAPHAHTVTTTMYDAQSDGISLRVGDVLKVGASVPNDGGDEIAIMQPDFYSEKEAVPGLISPHAVLCGLSKREPPARQTSATVIAIATGQTYMTAEYVFPPTPSPTPYVSTPCVTQMVNGAIYDPCRKTTGSSGYPGYRTDVIVRP